MGILKRMNPTCVELAEHLARGEYERAPWWIRLGVRWHLFRCDLCAKYARQLGLVAEAFRRSVRERGASADLDGLRKRLRERFRGS